MARSDQHITRVVETATDPGAAARSRLAASWRRSLDHHGLDPGQRDGVLRVSETDLAQSMRRNERGEVFEFDIRGCTGCGA